MDGANRFQRIRHIDIPGILPVITILFILAVGNIFNLGFEKVYLMQTDLNLPTSEVINTYVYKTGLQNAQVQLFRSDRAVQLRPQPHSSPDLQLGREEGQPVEPVVMNMSSILSPAKNSLRREPFHRRLADPLFALVTYGLIGLSIIAIIYPLYFIVIASISDPNLVQQGKVILFPRGVTFDGYLTIFGTSTIVRGFANSVLYTVVGTTLSVAMILTGAYALSRKDMPGRNLFMILFVITMFFDGA